MGHGRGRRFDPDQVHQSFNNLVDPPRSAWHWFWESSAASKQELEFTSLAYSSASPGDGFEFASRFVCSCGVLSNIKQIAPIDAQNKTDARRHNAKVNPTVAGTLNNFVISIFPPSYVPTLPGLSAPTRLISFVRPSITDAPSTVMFVPMKRRMR